MEFFELVSAYAWQHLAALVWGTVLMFLTATQGAILRWRQQSRAERQVACTAHTGIVERLERFDILCAEMSHVGQKVDCVIRQNDKLLHHVDTLLMRGPRSPYSGLSRRSD